MKPAFRSFYQETAPKLRAYIRRASGDAALADDILQETFYRFLRADLPEMGKLREEGLSLSNSEFPALRSLAKTETGTTLEPAGAFRQQGRSDDAEGQGDAMRFFAKLKPQEQTLLWLAYVEGFDHREVAAALQLKEKSVRVLLFRARKKLAGYSQQAGIRRRGGPMSQTDCPQEAAVSEAAQSGKVGGIRSGAMPPSAALPGDCADIALDAGDGAGCRRQVPLCRDASLLWWRAQLSERQAKLERTQRAVEWLQIVSSVLVGAGLLVWAVWNWRAVLGALGWLSSDVWSRVWLAGYLLAVSAPDLFWPIAVVVSLAMVCACLSAPGEGLNCYLARFSRKNWVTRLKTWMRAAASLMPWPRPA